MKIYVATRTPYNGLIPTGEWVISKHDAWPNGPEEEQFLVRKVRFLFWTWIVWGDLRHAQRFGSCGEAREHGFILGLYYDNSVRMPVYHAP